MNINPHAMKTIFKFIRATLTGGILFMLPVVLLIVFVNKAFQLLSKFSAPLAKVLPDFIFGMDGSILLSVLLLVLICFFSGLLFISPRIRRGIRSLEENVLSLLPGYALIKSIAADTVGEKVEEGLHAVMAQDGDAWLIGFLVEEGHGLCTIYFPGAPHPESGEVKILPSTLVKKLDIPANKVTRSLKGYGKGAVEWLK